MIATMYQDDMLAPMPVHPNPFRLPPSTPAVVPYPNLVNSSQFARNNFKPTKRAFKRVPSAQEDDTALRRVFQQYWGFSDFRGPQLDICRSVMGGCDVLVVAPTGIGKSVCFQVPAVALEYGITLVISPLLALMKDQVAGLKDKGIEAAMLYEKSPDKDVAFIKKQLRMGHPDLRILYLTPETLFSYRCSSELEAAYKQRQLRRLVVDEAHVIEEWGMTFRSAYRGLGKFRDMYPDVPVTAVTASATEEVRTDILNVLRIQKKDLAQWVEPFNRKNLFYEIRYQGVKMLCDRAGNAAEFIRTYRVEAMRKNKEQFIDMKCVSGLVYCRSRAVCEEVAAVLRNKGVNAQAFHAQLPEHKREERLHAWKAGEIECIVATIAFGMGVDHAHVRYVVHFDMPKSFEGYYQETGRAGRDGHASRCLLYYSREDATRLRGLIDKDAAAAEKRLMAESKKQPDVEFDETELDRAKVRCMNSYKFLQQYLESDRTCRHVAICRYFGEDIDDDNDEVRRAYCDSMCDVCSNPAAVRRRAAQITEEIEPASQVVRAPVVRAAEFLASSSPDRRVLGSIALVEGSDSIHPSSDPVEPTPQPSRSAARSLGQASILGSRSSPAVMVSQEANGSFTNVSSSGVLDERPMNSRMPAGLSEDQNGSKKPRLLDPTPARSFRSDSVAQRRATASPVSQRNQASTRYARQAQQVGPSRIIMASSTPPGSSFETPCPRPNNRGRMLDRIRETGPSRGPPRTVDGMFEGGDAGGYAVAPPMPEDPEVRERQADAFRGVTPIRGRGPYSYYTNTAAPTSHRKRRMSTATEGSFRTPFKTPFIKQRQTSRAGPIPVEARTQAIGAILDGLKKSLLDGEVSDGIWRYWGGDFGKEQRKKLLRLAAIEVESRFIAECATPGMLHAKADMLVQAVRILRSDAGARLITSGKLHEFGTDDHGRTLIVCEQAIRHVLAEEA